MNQETIQFIIDNKDKDVHQLALHSSRNPLVNMSLAIRQINGLQKVKNKIPCFYNNLNILYPAQLSLEQSSSETTAIYKSTLCKGTKLTDLTGGFGVDCFFMSANFEQVLYIERQEELCLLAKHNFTVLGAQHIEVKNAITEDYVNEMPCVDWIYIDPARRSSSGKKVVLLSDCEPNVAIMVNLLLQKSKNVMIKLSPMMDISAALTELTQTTEIHIVAVDNECKEIIFILNQDNSKKIIVKTVNFGKSNHIQHFDFEMNNEINSSSVLTSKIEKYLYEPNAAVMKSGAFKLIGNEFNMRKLHINTHLYTSSELLLHFPGRIFEVQKVWENGKSEIKKNCTRLSKANLTTRNYPINVDELRKKFKISDGGNVYLFACTLSNEEKVIIECEKVAL